MSKVKKAAVQTVDTSLVFAAAAAAHRINGGQYIKFNTQGTGAEPSATNREILDSLIAEPAGITDEDRECGEQIRTHFRGLTFKLLGGKVLNEYEQKSLQLASSESMNPRDSGVVASLPSSWARAMKRQSVEDRLADCLPEYAGPLGSKVRLEGEVVRCVYSANWGTHYATLITADGLAVFFGIRGPLEVGSRITVEGKVKAHRPGFQTQLNYVKII